MQQTFDVAIIGGGINGCACAADAALRGLSVVLLEQDDLASKTSSSSTKLIHGGLRYLEHYEFSLVKKALIERQRLLELAPHLVHPQAFVLPYQQHMRPAWLLKLGLFFYDHLSRKNRLPKGKTVFRSDKNLYFTPLVNGLNQGMHFYDAVTDDARLTITNALQAKHHGASVRPYSKVTKAEAKNNIWYLTIKPYKQPTYTLKAKTLINAGGPWVSLIAEQLKTPLHKKLSLVKGSHIVVPKLYEGDHAYILQHQDKRVIFVLPYHGFSMIGTTDVHYNGDLTCPQIAPEEISYLITLVNSYFSVSIHPKDIITSWSGLRPLLASAGKEAQRLSRDYYYEYNDSPAPILTILGGKITTYRQLAEEVVDQLATVFPNLPRSTTSITTLPGATLGTMNFEEYVAYARKRYTWLDEQLLSRYLSSYGSSTEHFLSSCTQMSSMGKKFGSSLYQVEVDYLISQEWARTCDDLLMRRTKLGLTMDKQDQQELADYLNNQ